LLKFCKRWGGAEGDAMRLNATKEGVTRTEASDDTHPR